MPNIRFVIRFGTE